MYSVVAAYIIQATAPNIPALNCLLISYESYSYIYGVLLICIELLKMNGAFGRLYQVNGASATLLCDIFDVTFLLPLFSLMK